MSTQAVDPLSDWWVHTVTVRAWKGRSGSGADVYGAPVNLTGYVAGGRRLVRDTNGEQVVSEATLALPSTAPVLIAGSKITLPARLGGRTTTILAVSIGDTGGLLDLDHAEYSLA